MSRVPINVYHKNGSRTVALFCLVPTTPAVVRRQLLSWHFVPLPAALRASVIALGWQALRITRYRGACSAKKQASKITTTLVRQRQDKGPIFGAMKKFALVGCGEVAARHAELLVRAGHLAAVCDVVKEKREAFSRQYNARGYENLDDLLAVEKEHHAVVICTPNGHHAEQVIKSLQARKHVVCELPLCLTTAAAWQIIETEKFCRRTVFMVSPMRQNAVLQRVKTYLNDGSFGPVRSFQLSCFFSGDDNYFGGWRGQLFPGGGALYSPFAPYVEAISLLFGEIEEVKGYSDGDASEFGKAVDKGGVVALQMKNGTIGSIYWQAGPFGREQETSLSISAANGSLLLTGRHLTELSYSGNNNSLSFPGDPVTDHLLAFYTRLQQALNQKDLVFGGAREGLAATEAIEKIYKSISRR